MKAPIESVRISERGREILITLKRRTGISNWNVLCRWAFCDSLANKNRPSPVSNQPESNIDMSWNTFAGEISGVIVSIFELRAEKDGIPREKHQRAAYFKSHVERGIAQLQNVKTLSELMRRGPHKTDS